MSVMREREQRQKETKKKGHAPNPGIEGGFLPEVIQELTFNKLGKG